MERKTPYKSEYYKGEIFAMAAAKIRHNALKDNFVALMMNHLRGKSCRTYSSDQSVLTATEDGLYSYPDIIAICGPPRFTDLVKDTVTNPTVIVEVLSKGFGR